MDNKADWSHVWEDQDRPDRCQSIFFISLLLYSTVWLFLNVCVYAVLCITIYHAG